MVWRRPSLTGEYRQEPVQPLLENRRPVRVVTKQLPRLKGRALLTAALAAAACTRANQSSNHVVADSAGIRVVTNSGPAWLPGAEWLVRRVARLTIPAAARSDSSPELLTVEGAIRLSDGTVVVGDRGASAVKYFDSAGRLVRSSGRQGQGPGEFEYLAWLQACGGDSAFALDIANRLVSVLGPDGKLSRRFTIRTSEVGGSPFSVRCRRNGRILASGWGLMQGTPTKPYRPTVPVSLAGPDGAVQVSLGRFPGTEMAPVFGGAGPRRLGRWLLLGLGDTTAWIATGESSELRGYDSTGTLRFLVRTPAARHSVSPRDIQFHRQLALDSSDSEAERDRVRAQFESTPAPSDFPPFSDFIVDAGDHLWLREYPRADDPVPDWLVFRPDGALLGRVRAPAALRILEIGLDYVLGVGPDSTGAQLVALHDLFKPRLP